MYYAYQARDRPHSCRWCLSGSLALHFQEVPHASQHWDEGPVWQANAARESCSALPNETPLRPLTFGDFGQRPDQCPALCAIVLTHPPAAALNHCRAALLPQVRGFPCDCAFPQYCDSQQGALPPTRMAASGGSLPAAVGTPAPTTAATAATAGSAGPAGPAEAVGEGAAATAEAAAAASRHTSGCAARPSAHEESRPATDGAEAACAGAAAGGPDGAADAAAAAGVGRGALGEEICLSAGPPAGPAAEEALSLLELEHVHKVYDAIAHHFSATRRVCERLLAPLRPLSLSNPCVKGPDT
jgi:hypothetical protein